MNITLHAVPSAWWRMFSPYLGFLFLRHVSVTYYENLSPCDAFDCYWLTANPNLNAVQLRSAGTELSFSFGHGECFQARPPYAPGVVGALFQVMA